MKTFMEVITEHITEATPQELLLIRIALDKAEGRNTILEYSKSIFNYGISPLLKSIRDFYVDSNYNYIATVKRFKEQTGWGLKESKDWCDENIKPYKPILINQ